MARWPWTKREREPSVRQQLEQALRENSALLSQAYAGFNAARDGELVESYIYEIQALQARYSYLLRQRKALDAQSGPTLPDRDRSALPVA